MVYVCRWVRTRWVLLILFWLGWVGMLAGAIVIIVKAPRCKPIPEMNWWNEGPIYQISDVDAFSDGLKGEITPMAISPFSQKNANLAVVRQPDWCCDTVLNRVKVL